MRIFLVALAALFSFLVVADASAKDTDSDKGTFVEAGVGSQISSSELDAIFSEETVFSFETDPSIVAKVRLGEDKGWWGWFAQYKYSGLDIALPDQFPLDLSTDSHTANVGAFVETDNWPVKLYGQSSFGLAAVQLQGLDFEGTTLNVGDVCPNYEGGAGIRYPIGMISVGVEYAYTHYFSCGFVEGNIDVSAPDTHEVLGTIRATF